MIAGFLDSPLGIEVAASRCDVEIPLLVDVGGVTVRGFADLLLQHSSPPLVLDYKTNNIEGSSPEEKMRGYELQRDLYGLAVAQTLERDEVDTAFVFLAAPDRPVRMKLGAVELEAAGKRIGELVTMIESGDFFGESNSAARPCGDCWACAKIG
jgi:hypothetical protein